MHLLEGCIKFVEIEVNSRCNRKCDYCPVAILPPPKVPLYMTNEVFDKITEGLVRINFSGVFAYHFYNEPLLRLDLEELVFQISKKFPSAKQLLYTNGDKLSDGRYKTLLFAGIDKFVITRHSNTPIADRPNQAVLYPGDLKINNRGGILSKLEQTLNLPCFSPSERLIVSLIGDVLICCNDADRKHIMGNIMEQSLEEIWFSGQMGRVRELLKEGNRKEASSICAVCDDQEYSVPD